MLFFFISRVNVYALTPVIELCSDESGSEASSEGSDANSQSV